MCSSRNGWEDRRRRRRSSPGWGGAAGAVRSSVDMVEWAGRGCGGAAATRNGNDGVAAP
jgi:hypothetical protein